jgi:hypothetical protein
MARRARADRSPILTRFRHLGLFFCTKFTGLDVEPPGVFEFRSLRLGSAGLHQHARLVGVFLKTDVRRESVVTGTRVADGLQYEFTAVPDFFYRYRDLLAIFRA